MPVIENARSGRVSRRGKNSVFTLEFDLKGYTNTSNALAAMLGASTSIIPASVIVDSYSLTERDYQVDPRGFGTDLHYGVVTYTHIESPSNTSQNPVLQETGDVESTIDFALSPSFTRRAKPTSVEYGTDCPSVNSTIGYNPGGLPKGTNVEKPASMLSYTKIEDAATVTDAWIVAREELLGQINNATFKGRPAETCRFERMTLRQRSVDGPIHTTFGFRHQPTGTLDLATLGIGETGTLTIYPYRIYEDIYEEAPEVGAGSKLFMSKSLIGLVEHQLEEIQPADFSIFGV